MDFFKHIQVPHEKTKNKTKKTDKPLYQLSQNLGMVKRIEMSRMTQTVYHVCHCWEQKGDAS